MFHNNRLRMEARGSCSQNYGKIVRKGYNGGFFADTDFVK